MCSRYDHFTSCCRSKLRRPTSALSHTLCSKLCAHVTTISHLPVAVLNFCTVSFVSSSCCSSLLSSISNSSNKTSGIPPSMDNVVYASPSTPACQLFTESRQLFTESRQLVTESRQSFTESPAVRAAEEQHSKKAFSSKPMIDTGDDCATVQMSLGFWVLGLV
jgi:hypothetical protein